MGTGEEGWVERGIERVLDLNLRSESDAISELRSREEEEKIMKYSIIFLINKPASRSRSKMGFRLQIVGLGHNGEAARSWLERHPPALLVGRGVAESSEDPLDLLPLHGADPDQRVGHRQAPRIEPVGRREGNVVLVVGVEMEALMEATVEGALVGSGKAQARTAMGGGISDRVGGEVVVGNGEGAAGAGGGWEERERG